MKIVEEYRYLTEEIAVVENQIFKLERELKKIQDIYKPKDVKSICYDEPCVQTSKREVDIEDVAMRINEIVYEFNKLKEDYHALVCQKQKLTEIIDQMGDVEKRVLKLRIDGLSTKQISGFIGMSQRQVQRILKDSESCRPMSS